MSLKTIRLIGRTILPFIARVNVINAEKIPKTGRCIVVSNHIGRLDAMLAMLLAERDDVIMMIAEKYQAYAVWRWVARQVNAIWLNRFDTDFHALREAYKRLRQGGILAIAPEGTRSKTGQLTEGKQGTAYLAAKAKAPIVPIAITGSEDAVVKSLFKRLRRPHITIHVGSPFTLPPMSREDRDAYLNEQTTEIMCRIAALLPDNYRGVYANHPHLQKLLAEAPALGDPSYK